MTAPAASAVTVHRIPHDRLCAAMRVVVRGFGSTPDEVDAVVDNLVEANLRGHDSHGIGMLPRYAEAFLEGSLQVNAHARVDLDSGTLLRVDGGCGFGQVIGREALDLAIARARRHGSCLLAIGHSHHLGRIGAWAEQAAAAGLVSVHFVNVMARPIVAPHGGAQARYGTNPFCVGVPRPDAPPLVLDFATSVIAQGKTRVAHNQGVAIEPGCVIDPQGHDSTDPRWTVVPPFGALLPFGGELGAHKGYGLALMCELLGGALASGMTLRDQPENLDKRRVLNGMFSVLVDPQALGGGSAFDAEVGAFVDWVKSAPARPGFEPVQVAGEPELARRAQRLAEGLAVDATTWQEIEQAAARLGVDVAAVRREAGLAG
ncbi:MAG: hypothetical protein RLY78_2225 [Pseudomonadota bacterium]|jgi:uncharacterized oxidoreductase